MAIFNSFLYVYQRVIVVIISMPQPGTRTDQHRSQAFPRHSLFKILFKESAQKIFRSFEKLTSGWWVSPQNDDSRLRLNHRKMENFQNVWNHWNKRVSSKGIQKWYFDVAIETEPPNAGDILQDFAIEMEPPNETTYGGIIPGLTWHPWNFKMETPQNWLWKRIFRLEMAKLWPT